MAQAKARDKPTGVATNAILAWEERKGLWSLNELNDLACNICVYLPHSAKSLQGNSRKTQNKSSDHYGTYMPLAMKESDQTRGLYVHGACDV